MSLGAAELARAESWRQEDLQRWWVMLEEKKKKKKKERKKEKEGDASMHEKWENSKAGQLETKLTQFLIG